MTKAAVQEPLPADRFLSAGRKAHLRLWNVTETARDVRFVRTEDGWHLALSRYGGLGKVPGARRHPVLLVHGLGSNRLAFDLAPEVSLSAFLARLGFDVFALDLRGHGRSEKPRLFHPKDWGWNFHDYASKDLPAALDGVLDWTGAAGVHVVGHSMGGIALHTRVAKLDPRIRSGTTLGASIDYSGTKTVFHSLIKWIWATYLMPAVPLGGLTRSMAPLALAFDNPVDRGNVFPSNVDRRLYRGLVGTAFHGISSPVLRSLSKAFRPGGLCDENGDGYGDAVPGETPVLALAGTKDVQCAPEAAARRSTEMRAFGRAFDHEDDYGHFDLIMGKRAATETWPVLAEWLASHDS